MLFSYDPDRRALVERPTHSTSPWIHAIDPSPDEVAVLVALGVDASDLEHALDPDEVARVATHGGHELVILRLPFRPSEPGELPFRAATAGVVVLSDRRLFTVSRYPSEVFARVAARGPVFSGPWQLVLFLIEEIADSFLRHLREVDAQVEKLEGDLQESLRNREVLELLRYQKSLVHFTTSLSSIELMLERLARHAAPSLSEEDRAQLEDARIEVRQAREMCGVSENILSQMMDAFASIIANNLNVVMKVLTAATVILSLPMLVASVYGMNVPLPGQHHPAAFVMVVIACVLLSLGGALLLRRLRWL